MISCLLKLICINFNNFFRVFINYIFHICRPSYPKFHTMKPFKSFCFLLFISSFNLIAQQLPNTAKKEYHTLEINLSFAPVIDGALNDSVWSSVEWGSDFVEVQPDENTAASVQTKFKVLYDQKYLYVALKALDPEPETITKRLSRRDGFVGDRINVLIDSYHDLRTAFLFTVFI